MKLLSFLAVSALAEEALSRSKRSPTECRAACDADYDYGILDVTQEECYEGCGEINGIAKLANEDLGSCQK